MACAPGYIRAVFISMEHADWLIVSRNIHHHDLGQNLLPAVRNRTENGTLYLNEAPGLGLTLSEEAIEKFGTRIA